MGKIENAKLIKVVHLTAEDRAQIAVWVSEQTDAYARYTAARNCIEKFYQDKVGAGQDYKIDESGEYLLVSKF